MWLYMEYPFPLGHNMDVKRQSNKLQQSLELIISSILFLLLQAPSGIDFLVNKQRLFAKRKFSSLISDFL